ncbi:hypothetical protein MTO96_028246 [Rhipicephalus appendiculatus]
MGGKTGSSLVVQWLPKWSPALQAASENPSWSGYESGPCSATPACTGTVACIFYPEWNLLLATRPEMTMKVWGDALNLVVAVPAEVPSGPGPVDWGPDAGGTARVFGGVIPSS